MPSPRIPRSAVSPGAGVAPARSVPQNALLGSTSGLSELTQHEADAIDAHMASAIGIPAVDTETAYPLLDSAGGPIDGESLKDFVAAFVDLQPVRPDRIGFNELSIPNSGEPVWMWGTNPDGLAGGFDDGGSIGYARQIVDATQVSWYVEGFVYPADRGCLALYASTTHDYFDAPNTTLVGALWLGPGPAPAGIPDAQFQETARHNQQTSYTPAFAGIDQITLTNRVLYTTDYTPFSLPFANFPATFSRFQIATYIMPTRSLSGGDNNGSWLIVHWREGFVTSLADIQPANVTLATLVSANLYSAPPGGGGFDDPYIETINRYRVFQDTASATVPSGASFSGTQVGIPPTVTLSGVAHYTKNIQWNFDVRINDLANRSFFTGYTTGAYASAAPMSLDFTAFGGGQVDYQITDLKPTGGANYSNGNAPAIGDQVQLTTSVTLTVLTPTPIDIAPVGGYGQLKVVARKPYQTLNYVDPNLKWLFNSYTQTGAAIANPTTTEAFRNEYYRYLSNYAAGSATATIVPAVGDKFVSATVLAANDGKLQVIGGQLVYPGVNYGAADFRPAGQPDYATVQAADGAGHIRRFVRAFDTGGPTCRGTLKLTKASMSDWEAAVPYTGTENIDHSLGILQVKVPAVSGWMDAGRNKGDPDALTTDFRGCRISAREDPDYLYITYDTYPAFTSDNGSGEFPIFVRISYVQGTGFGMTLDGIEWVPA